MEKEKTVGRKLTPMECAGFIGGFIGGLCGFAPLEVVRDAVRECQEEFSRMAQADDFQLPLNHAGEMDSVQVRLAMKQLCALIHSLFTGPEGIDEALDIFLDPTNPVSQRVWQMAKLGRDVKLGKICQLCGGRDHKSENCPNVKQKSSLVMPD